MTRLAPWPDRYRLVLDGTSSGWRPKAGFVGIGQRNRNAIPIPKRSDQGELGQSSVLLVTSNVRGTVGQSFVIWPRPGERLCQRSGTIILYSADYPDRIECGCSTHRIREADLTVACAPAIRESYRCRCAERIDFFRGSGIGFFATRLIIKSPIMVDLSEKLFLAEDYENLATYSYSVRRLKKRQRDN